MINFKKLFETVYEPKAGDEKNFKDKHVIAKHKTPFDSESQFTSNAKKAKRPADHDAGEDEAVYEAANVHTKRADKEPVIVRDVDPKTGQSKARVVMRRTGEIKIGEEVELEEGTVGHGKYTITTGPKMSGMGEGGPAHVVAKRAKMAKLGVPHHDDPGEYGHTVRVTVKNNDTGETTHHHVYQRDTDRGSKEALVSTRTVGTPRAKQKEHEKVLHNYLAGKKVSSLKEEAVVVTELGEKVANPYAIGMAAAMKQTGDTPPLKKSTIVKGHEIAKSIKKEALDPVGKADADINNDGKVDSTDKYLHNRRKAIGKALRKEDLDEAVEVRHDRYMRSHGKKARDSGHGAGSWMFTHKSMGGVDYNNDKEVHTARGSFSDAKKSAQKWAKEHGHHAVYVMEEIDQLDELSPNTLHSYIKKAAGNMAGNAAVAAAQASSSMKKSSPDVKRNITNRMKGITGASGRLADKANMAEEVDTGENTAELDNSTFKNYIKSNKPNKIKDVNEADAKTNSEASHKKYIKGNEKAPHQSFKEEVEQIDELSRKTLSSYVKKAAGVAHRNTLPNAMRDRMTAANTGDKEWYKQSGRNADNRSKGIQRAADRLAKEDLDEAFKVGAMKLHDGSSVTLTRESVDSLNGLFHQLNAANKSKMEERMMSGKKGFQEILSFAENI